MIDDLRPLQTRQYLDASFHAENPLHVTRFLKQLKESIPTDFRSAHEWFSLFHEGSIAIQDIHARLEIATQVDTTSQEAETRLRNFESHVLSQLLEIRRELMDIYLSSPWRTAMHSDDHERIRRDFAVRKKYAKPELAKMQIEENAIIRDYKKFVNGSNAFWDNTEVPLPIIVGRMNDNSAATRRKAFFSYWKFVKENEIRAQHFFTKLIENRTAQAAAVNETSYTPLAFAELGRIDYGPTECATFRKNIEKFVVPCVSKLAKKQAASLNESAIAPWSASFWPSLMPQRQPAGGDIHKIISGLGNILHKTDPAFGRLFDSMLRQGVIDVLPTSRKSPGAFCVTLQESGIPFIFGNFAGNTKDAMTLLHEFGHALHSHASSYIPNTLLRTPGMEICELMSTSMEILAFPSFSEWWKHGDNANLAQAYHLFGMLTFWPFMSMVDEWQHAVYSHPDGTDPKVRNYLWKELSARFRPHINWSGAEEFEELGWFSRPHVFTSPFYYVDYGIAQLGALQLWEKSRTNHRSAVDDYIVGLSLGGQRSLPEIFTAMGIKFEFSEKIITRLVAELEKTIQNALG